MRTLSGGDSTGVPMTGFDGAETAPPEGSRPDSAAISRCAFQIARAGPPMARRSRLWAMAAAIPWQAALTYWRSQGELLVRGDTSVRAVGRRREVNDISTGILTVVVVGVGLVAAVAASAAAALVVFLVAAPVLIDLPVRLPVVTKLEWRLNLGWHGDDPIWVHDDGRDRAFVYALVLSWGTREDRRHLLHELSQAWGRPVMVASLNQD